MDTSVRNTGGARVSEEGLYHHFLRARRMRYDLEGERQGGGGQLGAERP